MKTNENIKMDEYGYFDNVFSFEGAVSVEKKENYCAPWRIDYEQKELFPSIKDKVGRLCSGIRLCFSTDAENIALKLSEIEEAMLIDVIINGEFNQQLKIENTDIVYFNKLNNEFKNVEIWLAQSQSFKLEKVMISEGSKISKSLVKQKRWVHYGSSISQSNDASSPSKTWAAMTARKRNLHLTNLGFSGECVFDPMVALQIRDLPADYITLKLGINTYPGLQTKRMFEPCVIAFIKIIREKHPSTPLTVLSPIYCESRETILGECGLCLQDMRKILQNVVNTFKKYGDRNIYYLSGLELLGEEHKKLLPDNLHPNAEAQYIMSNNFVNKVFDRMPS